MDAIYIPQLIRASERTEEVQVNEFLPGLETLTPVRGHVRVQHNGTYLEVSSQAETIITCTCNRCLQQYNRRLGIDTKEIIWLDETANQVNDLPLEREVVMEELLESLPPDGYFYPNQWLYEQMCLAVPLGQLCDRNCPGIPVSNTVDSSDSSDSSETPVDNRWASLEALKKQLPG